MVTTGDRSWCLGAKQVLGELNADGFRLGLISNTGILQRVELLELLPPDFSFDDFEDELVVLSSELTPQVEKPDFRIFLHALSAAQTSPGKCLFVTEDILHTLAAQEVGMGTIRVAGEDDDRRKISAALREFDELF